ncbi:hypothetical protein TIFTF001_006519 [Ficus carica]|uniref:Uncharacterized protein n=1 Tax=Ficus carica TaxID=3494 RepID=A0AA88A4B9_FICCA|nr:hypothetical protein TIFTF001_006519 [Ficus carica]
MTYGPVQGRVGLWIELEMDWPPQPLHSCAPGTVTHDKGPTSKLRNEIVLAERKLTSYVYAVGKQPTGDFLYKMVELAGQL